MLDNESHLILCQHGERRIARLNAALSHPQSKFITLADTYDDKPFNSPNDLDIDRAGNIYFTDPPYGQPKTKTAEIGINGVFKVAPSGAVTMLIDSLDRPNGIALSLDQKYLYIKKMGVFDHKPKVLKLNLETKKISTLFDGRKISEEYGGDFDGIKVHSSGNIFFSGGGGILIVNPGGKLMARINFGNATNCAFDKDEKYLYVTGHLDNPKVFRIRLKNSINIGKSIKIQTH